MSFEELRASINGFLSDFDSKQDLDSVMSELQVHPSLFKALLDTKDVDNFHHLSFTVFGHDDLCVAATRFYASSVMAKLFNDL